MRCWFLATEFEESNGFNRLSGGWGGVYHWCRQAVARSGGAIRHDLLFVSYDLLVLHLDADVADKQYADASIDDAVNNLPCSQPCPPADNTTNALRVVLLRWVGEMCVPPRTVLCTPSKCTEAWVLSALYQADRVVVSGNVECHASPDLQLQAKPLRGRLVSGGKKFPKMYRKRAPEISAAWAHVRVRCTEAERFSNEVGAVVPPM